MSGRLGGQASGTDPDTDTGSVVGVQELGRVHFVGIGGAGMSGIARIMLARGVVVSGSDARDSRALTVLRALGAAVHVGHDAGRVVSADSLVVSSAVRESNPELVEARARDLRVLHRSQALAAVMVGRRSVAVAGTHGKTTTTSMLTVTLQHCGVDPSFAIGGELTESGANAHDGSGDIFVAEADESDGSFLLYEPTVAIVTNVEADHLDHYGTAEAVEEAFDSFAGRVVPGGFLVACADDAGSRRVAERARAQGVDVRLYGESEDADVRVVDLDATGAGVSFGVVRHGRREGAVRLRMPGRHNALNAAAAWTTATGLGMAAANVRAGLEAFGGTRRRFELRGEADGVRVFDEYSHHPTEVEAGLLAARAVAGRGRVVAVFQPHLFSRTRIFATDFGRVLGLADEVVVMDVYAAREDPEPGVTGALIADAIALGDDRACFVPSWSAVADETASRARPGDIVLTIGAGDVTMIGPEVLAVLARRRQHRLAGNELRVDPVQREPAS